MSSLAGRTVAERLDLDLLRDLRDDIRLMSYDGMQVLFAVDAYDILRYCFPLAPREGAAFTRDVAVEADYFATLSFVLRTRALRPVLLPEYLSEIHGFVGSVQQRGAYGNADAQLARNVEAALRSQIDDVPDPGKENETVAFVRDNFSKVVLLAAAEMARLGIRELTYLVRERLVSLAGFPPEASEEPGLRDVLRRAAEAYEPDRQFIRRCERTLASMYPIDRGPKQRGGTGHETSNRTDAIALDRVMRVNAELHRAFEAKRLRRPHAILLLSSSRRLLRLQNALRAEDASAGGSPGGGRTAVRVPDQVFAFMIAQPNDSADGQAPGPAEGAGAGGGDADAQRATLRVLDTLEWLVELGGEASTLRLRTRSCDACVLAGHANDRCPNRATCTRLALLEENRRRILRPYQDSTENLALFSQWGGLLLRSAAHSDGGPEVLDRVRRLLEHEKATGQAADALWLYRDLVHARTILAHRWCIGIERGQARDVATESTRDNIRGAYQALPWLIGVSTPQMTEILEIAREAFFQHPDSARARQEGLVSAFASLIAVDNQRALEEERGAESADGRRLDIEANLVRAVLFLALCDPQTEQAAVALAQHAVDTAEDQQRMDALYVLSWALRRIGRFEQAIDCASQGIAKDASDPRLYHARALGRFAKARAGGGGHFDLMSVERDLEEARRLYDAPDAAWPHMRPVMVAGCINGLAYVSALNATQPSALRRARTLIGELKSVFPREQWEPRHPEFFHTEAFLEREEAKRIGDGSAKRAKLRHAAEAVGRAVELAPHRKDYGELQREIAKELGAS